MLVALIVRRPHRLTMSEWKAHVRSNTILIPLEARETVNPFTGTPTILEPNEGDVWISIEGVRVGAIEPDPEFARNGELLVYADDQKEAAVRGAAAAVAAGLNAVLEWIPPDEPI